MTEPRRIDRPQPGHYRTRLARGAPFVPARLWWELPIDPDTGALLDRSPKLRCMVAGEERDPIEVWPYLHEVDEREYARLLVAMPDDPRAPIDLPEADVPDLGQTVEISDNLPPLQQRDRWIQLAAEAGLRVKPEEADDATAGKMAQIVKQANALDKLAAKAKRDAGGELKRQLDEVADEYGVEAKDTAGRVLDWLTAYGNAHGGDLPSPAGCRPHWKNAGVQIAVDDFEAVPREFLMLDQEAVVNATTAGKVVPGCRIIPTRKVVVS